VACNDLAVCRDYTVMGNAGDRPVRRTNFQRVIESNERRLEALDRQGVPLVVDGRRVLQFFFDRALASVTLRDFDHEWALNVTGLVKQFETEAHATEIPAAS